MRLNKKIRLAGSYIISTISITFVLLILGFFALLLLNTRDLSKNAKENIVITVILKPESEQGEIDFLQKKIAALPFCLQVKLVTPEEALDDLKQDLGEDITDVLDFNPLPASLNINPNEIYANSDSLQIIEKWLKQEDVVENVFYNRNLVYQLDKNVKKISLAVFVLELLLIIMAISLINNTVRMLVYSKRFEIKTMLLVGATSRFIMKPFILRSFWHGLYGSLIAIASIIIAILSYQSNVEDIIQINHLEIVFGIILFAGLCLTVFSTYIFVKKYINAKQEDIYY